MNNIKVREEMERATERTTKRTSYGFYKLPGFSKKDARKRRDFLEDFVDELDFRIKESNDMDSITRNKYNDLRGELLNLIDRETDNIRIGE